MATNNNNGINDEIFKLLFFTKIDEHRYRCNKCKGEITCRVSGYSCFRNHITQRKSNKHIGYEYDITNYHRIYANDIKQFEIDITFAGKGAYNYYGWMKQIIDLNLPFNYVEQPVILKYSNLEAISTNNLIKYIEGVSLIVEQKITARLPDKFGIIFGGWSISDKHFAGLVAVIPDDILIRRYFLLQVQLIPDQNIITYKNFIIETLHIYHKTLLNILFLVADSTTINIAIAKECGVNMICCHSYLLNLEVQDYFESDVYISIINKVTTIMTKLGNFNHSGRLAMFGQMQNMLLNGTQWNSTAEMIDRYVILTLILNPFNFPDIPPNAFLTVEENAAVLGIQSQLKCIDSVAKAMLSDDIDINSARILIIELIKRFPKFTNKLTIESRNVFYSNFNKAVAKLLNHNLLNAEDEKELTSFLINNLIIKLDNNNNNNNNNIEEIDFAEQLLKKSKFSNLTSKYINLMFIPPNSTVIDKLISSTKYIYSDVRRNVLPSQLTSLLILQMHSDLWSEVDVQKYINYMYSISLNNNKNDNNINDNAINNNNDIRYKDSKNNVNTNINNNNDKDNDNNNISNSSHI